QRPVPSIHLNADVNGAHAAARPGEVTRIQDRPSPPWTARQTRYGVAGMAISVTPRGRSASRMPLTMQAGAAVVPPSPPALMPSGLVGDSTSAISVRNEGMLSERGMP